MIKFIILLLLSPFILVGSILMIAAFFSMLVAAVQFAVPFAILCLLIGIFYENQEI